MKTMEKVFCKITEVLPIVGGIGGGVSGGFSEWLGNYGPTMMSALIFAIVGGITGFLVSKLMQWIWCKVCGRKLKDK